MRFKGFLIALVTLTGGVSLQAAAINYGNFGPVGGVTFLNVTESSATDPVPMYNAPAPYVTGLNFTPTGFAATASGGSIDITDGQLNFSMNAAPGEAITGFNINERGDFTLVGSGTAQSQVLAGVIVLATVTGINGVPVAPISLAASNASVGFNLISNPGSVQPWGLGTGVTVPGALGNVTSIDIAINNGLDALSEADSLAFIAKKDFNFSVITAPTPEPASLGVAAMAGLLLARRRRAI